MENHKHRLLYYLVATNKHFKAILVHFINVSKLAKVFKNWPHKKPLAKLNLFPSAIHNWFFHFNFVVVEKRVWLIQ